MEWTFHTITQKDPNKYQWEFEGNNKKIFKDFRGTIMQKYAHTHTHTPQPLLSITQEGVEPPWKLSGCQGQKGEGLLRLHGSSSLIYSHRHAELWTLGWSSEVPSIFKGWLCLTEPPDAVRPEGIPAGLTQLCAVYTAALSSAGYSTLASPSTPVLWLWAGTRLAAAGSSALFSWQKDVETG